MYKNNELREFELFIKELKRQEYDFVFFKELNKSHNQVIIRHDIDFDVKLALDIAKIEYKNEIKSTFFFLIFNESYNPFSKNNFDMINEIKEMGHKISIHFDPVTYSDFEKGFKLEKKLFETLFNVNVEIISLHRPNEYFQNHNQLIDGCEHTYMDKYFKEIKYVSDSTGVFRFGHPFNTQEFLEKKSLHILIHPLWWTLEGSSNHSKLKTFFEYKKRLLKSHYSLNCKPFNDIKNEIN